MFDDMLHQGELYVTNVSNVNNGACTDPDGKMLRTIGNHSIYNGGYEFTDGTAIYGNEKINNGAAPIPTIYDVVYLHDDYEKMELWKLNPYSLASTKLADIPQDVYCLVSTENGCFAIGLGAIKYEDANVKVYDLVNGKVFSYQKYDNGNWYTFKDATVDKKGNLLTCEFSRKNEETCIFVRKNGEIEKILSPSDFGSKKGYIKDARIHEDGTVSAIYSTQTGYSSETKILNQSIHSLKEECVLYFRSKSDWFTRKGWDEYAEFVDKYGFSPYDGYTYESTKTVTISSFKYMLFDGVLSKTNNIETETTKNILIDEKIYNKNVPDVNTSEGNVPLYSYDFRRGGGYPDDKEIVGNNPMEIYACPAFCLDGSENSGIIYDAKKYWNEPFSFVKADDANVLHYYVKDYFMLVVDGDTFPGQKSSEEYSRDITDIDFHLGERMNGDWYTAKTVNAWFPDMRDICQISTSNVLYTDGYVVTKNGKKVEIPCLRTIKNYRVRRTKFSNKIKKNANKFFNQSSKGES